VSQIHGYALWLNPGKCFFNGGNVGLLAMEIICTCGISASQTCHRCWRHSQLIVTCACVRACVWGWHHLFLECGKWLVLCAETLPCSFFIHWANKFMQLCPHGHRTKPYFVVSVVFSIVVRRFLCVFHVRALVCTAAWWPCSILSMCVLHRIFLPIDVQARSLVRCCFFCVWLTLRYVSRPAASDVFWRQYRSPQP